MSVEDVKVNWVIVLHFDRLLLLCTAPKKGVERYGKEMLHTLVKIGVSFLNRLKMQTVTAFKILRIVVRHETSCNLVYECLDIAN